MVDCRLCKHCYKLWADEMFDEEPGTYRIVCLEKEIFVDKEYVTNGPCEYYVDVDGYNSE